MRNFSFRVSLPLPLFLLVAFGLMVSLPGYANCKPRRKLHRRIHTSQDLGLPGPVTQINGDCLGVPDCSRNQGSIKRPDPAKKAIWTLFAQKTVEGNVYQTWYDGVTGLLWGDKLDTDYMQGCLGDLCKYQGKYALEMTLEGSPVKEDACSSAEGQLASVGSAYRHFGLPSLAEYNQANADGMNDVLPHMDHVFWTSTLHPLSRDYARVFYGNTRLWQLQSFALHDMRSVRCVGRP